MVGAWKDCNLFVLTSNILNTCSGHCNSNRSYGHHPASQVFCVFISFVSVSEAFVITSVVVYIDLYFALLIPVNCCMPIGNEWCSASSRSLCCVYIIFIFRKEEGMAIHPPFNVSVIFGKRDEVRLPVHYSLLVLYIPC